jgi:uncharacterized protein (DUF362 family)
MKSPQPVVSLIKSSSYELRSLESDITSLLEPLGGISAIIKPGDRVLLKPNLVTGARPGKECITRPEIIVAVAKIVQAAGGKPFIGDSPTFSTAQGVLQSAGYMPWIKDLGLPIVELKSDRILSSTDSNKEFDHLWLSKFAMQADKVINLPKIKSHSQTVLTLGVKNLFGCVPGNIKAWWHMEIGHNPIKFSEMLVETAKTIDPNLTIIDGIIGHEGNGPLDGNPVFLGFLGASQDVFVLDRAIAEILNIDPRLIPTIVAAEKMNLCSNLDDCQFSLLQPKDLIYANWQLPKKYLPLDFGLPKLARSLLKPLMYFSLRLKGTSKYLLLP